MRFDESFIEQVRQANDIVEVIGAHTELREKGDRLWGRCPFPDHSEKTPSFSVSSSTQLYYCFGCKKGGTVFTFLKDYQGLPFPEAMEYLARRASIPIPEEAPKQAAARENRDLLLKVNRLAAVFFHHALKALPAVHPVRDYLVKRGLTAEIIEKFRVGLTTEAWQGLIDALKTKGVPLQAAETLGLIKKKKTGNDYFDLFRNRIMFPIFSPSDDVLGFGGRTYTDENPKYLNSPETPLFHKGKVLYGLHETGKFIRSQDRAIVVEGYMDVIALYGAGIHNTVAILGTAFTPEHAKLIKRYTSQVTMLLDGDEAGITAAERSLPILLASGLRVRGCFLPDGQDPDDFVKTHGVEALNEHLEGARELFSLVISRWLEGYKASPGEKVDLVKKAAPLLRAVDSQQLVELYVQEVAQRLDVEVQWIRRTLQEWSRDQAQKTSGMVGHASAKGAPTPTENIKNSQTPEEPQLEVISLRNSPKDEAVLFSLLLQNRTLFEKARDEQVFELFTDDGLRKLARMALSKHLQNPSGFDSLAASLMSFVDTPSVITSALEITQGPKNGSRDEDEEIKLVESYLSAVRKKSLKNQAKALANQLRDTGNSQDRNETLEQFMNIQRDRMEIKQAKETDGHE